MADNFFDQLQDDILQDILLRLHFRSILSCKAVSKSLYNFITSTRFLDAHLRISKNDFRLQPLFLGTTDVTDDDYHHNYCTMISVINNEELRPRAIVAMPGSSLLCYCDGIFLVQGDKARKFLLWNPSSRNVTPFYYPYRVTGVYGLCRDSIDSAQFYIIIGEGSRYAVYSSKARSWRKIDFLPPGDIRNTAGLYVDGAVYWDWVREDGNLYIQSYVGFDSRDEAFKILEKPEILRDTDQIYLVSNCDDQLCAWFNDVEKSVVQIWSWNEDSWRDFMTIPDVAPRFGAIRPLYFLQDRILIHVQGPMFLIYIISTNMFIEFEDMWDMTTNDLFPYLDSLVLFRMLRTLPPRRCRSNQLLE